MFAQRVWQLDLLLAMGFGVGLYDFFKGFQVYREYRIIEDTPRTPIRSIAMGLVHVRGRASGSETVLSPVTRTPCFFYKVDIEKWEGGRDAPPGWRHVKTDAEGINFYLEDSTGKVLVDVHGAEYDLIQQGQRAIGNSGVSLGKLLSGRVDPSQSLDSGATDAELAHYVARVGPGIHVSVRLSTGSEHGIASGVGNEGLGRVVFEEDQPLTPLASQERFRLKEYCILPDQTYDVSGTCVENPHPRDEHDRNMIVRGGDEPTFLISSGRPKDIERALRRRAALYVFGGGALAVMCLYAFIVLARLGWL
jgi:hypothetical protein